MRQLRARPELREALWRNANRLYQSLKELGLQIGPQVSPVIAVRLENEEQALPCWNRLLEAGVYTNLMMPPASPDGFSYLRCSVSAAHTPEQLEVIISAFADL